MTKSREFRLSVLFVLIAGAILLQRCQPESLQARIEKELSAVEGEFAVAFEDLTTGEQLLINSRERFHAASTMKTPVMIEVYRQVGEGRLTMDDSIEIKDTFSSIVDNSPFTLEAEGDSDQEIYQHIGRKLTLYNLVYRMITLSSDLATNLIIERVGATNVTATMRALGAKDIEVLRGVEDNKAFEKGLNNSITAFDQMLIMKKLALGEAVSAGASAAMMNILFDQHFREIIPAKLPTNVKVADKRGWITGLEHDCAIVVLPDGRRYVLILLSRKLTDRDKGVEAMANVSRIVYDHVMHNNTPSQK